jgi:endonuclease/exonuclease/phosphatase family metal-dependent hydrolase
MKNIYLSFIVIFSFFLAACSGKVNMNKIKVMTFNIRYDNPGDSIYSWTNRASQICNFVKNEKPDIVGLQEVLIQQYDDLDSVLKEYSSVGVGRDDGAKAGEMNPIFYRKARFDMVRTITFWLSETPDIPGSKAWGASLPRIITWMELVEKKNHAHFFFFNTHFADDSDSARIMSSQALLSAVESVADGFPFIITGDFNMLPSSKGYEILTGPAESVPLLKDSYLISEKRPTGPASTFNVLSDKDGTGRYDYIFVRNGMKVFDHSTVIIKEKGIFISDNWPIMASVSIK